MANTEIFTLKVHLDVFGACWPYVEHVQHSLQVGNCIPLEPPLRPTPENALFLKVDPCTPGHTDFAYVFTVERPFLMWYRDPESSRLRVVPGFCIDKLPNVIDVDDNFKFAFEKVNGKIVIQCKGNKKFVRVGKGIFNTPLIADVEQACCATGFVFEAVQPPFPVLPPVNAPPAGLLIKV